MGDDMKKAFLIIMLLVLSLGCAAGKSTQEPSSPQEKCERPVWFEGDSWKFTGAGGQWEEEIVREGNTFEIKQTPRKAFYGVLTIPIDLFPLWVGKRYGGAEPLKTSEGMDMGGTYSFNVVEIMDVQVEAGRFKCYRVEFTLYSNWDLTNFGIGYYYYSPETKSIVKFYTRSSLLTYWPNYELSSFNVR